MKDLRTVTLSVDGVRVRPTRQIGAFRVDCSLIVDNGERVAVGGAIRMADLPMGWRAIETAVSIPPIAPLTQHHVTLSALAENLSWNANGVIDIPISFDTGDGAPYTTTARLCYVVSQRRDTPIRIDGNLADWTGTSGNVASGFRLLSGSTADESNGHTETRCFISHDEERLYFGIHCTMRKNYAPELIYGNTVLYEDTVPIGEELFEILIDPTNAGTHSPEDLYHFAIKQAGAVFEKGIGMDPPVGTRRTWEGDVQYASQRTDDAWVIEASVPLDAFGGTSENPRVWGINFARFNADSQTYSTWSGARHNAYDPMSLGNVAMP